MNLHAMLAQIINPRGPKRHPSPLTMAERVRTLLDDAGWQVSPVILPDELASYAIVVAGSDGHAYRVTVTVEDGQ